MDDTIESVRRHGIIEPITVTPEGDRYHDTESMEIGGVLASLGEWRRLLLPLLNPSPPVAALPARKRQKIPTGAPAPRLP